MKNKLSSLRNLPRLFPVLGILALLSLGIAAPTTALAAPQKCDVKDTQCVITFGDQRIAERLTALNTVDGKVTTLHDKKQIDDSHADSIHADIKSNVDGLNDLKKKLDAETTAKGAREDVKNVYEQLRIFAVVIPRDDRRLQIGVAIVLDDKFVDLKAHIEQVIDQAPADKKANLTTLYSDYKTQLSAAETQIDVAQGLWPTLTPTNYNTNRTVYTTSLKSLETAEKTIHTDLHQVASDLHQIAQATQKSK